MEPINIKEFTKQYQKKRKGFRSFLTKLENNPPKGLDSLTQKADKIVWENTDCLSCANCCKKMTPTFTTTDIKRIATYLNMTPASFKRKWLTYEKKDKDWVNVSQPCQFLDLKTNMCQIYEVRPADCAGFPHLVKKKTVDYLHVHKQNIAYCPATFKFVELMQSLVKVK